MVFYCKKEKNGFEMDVGRWTVGRWACKFQNEKQILKET